jgi:hypothetical protein
MKILRIPLSSPNFPLPADYTSLTKAGQRMARVNASRQWLLDCQEPDEKAERFIRSHSFFDIYYLQPDPDTEFEPMFYDDPPLQMPPMHYALLRNVALYNRTITTLPRGAAKSTLARRLIIQYLVTRPMYSVVYATSSGMNARETGQRVKAQCYENPRILEDFAPEYKGRMKPSHGDAPKGIDFFYLNNGSWLRCISADSKQRGGRPRRYILDDPEYDPRASTSMTIVRGYMDRLINKIVLPMVMRPDTGVDWFNTFVSKRHYAWAAMETITLPSGLVVAKDPRFNNWSRLLIKAEYDDAEGVRRSCWPQMWPLTESDKKDDPTIHRNAISLESIKEQIGVANYNSEYLAEPGTEGEAFFPEIGEAHAWKPINTDHDFETNPLQSKASICFQRNGEQVVMPMADFAKQARFFITVDTSYTARSDSDYKVCTCMAYIPNHNELFVMEIWGKQCLQKELVEATLRMAERWRASIHPEVVRESYGLYHELDSLCRTKALSLTFAPKVVAVKPGMTRKEDKIAALEVRFRLGTIKLPTWNSSNPAVRKLLEQIGEFNPDADNGGLQHDDHIDTVAMSMFVIRSRTYDRTKPEEERTPLSRIMDGELYDATGAPLGLGVDWSKVDPEYVMQKVLEKDRHESNRPTLA